MDEFYFEEGYLEASYFTVIREANSALTFAAVVQSAVDIAATTGYYIPDYIATDYFESGIIIQGAADFSSTAAVSITVTRVRSASGAFTAVFQQVAALSDISGSDLFAFAEAAISIQINVIRSANTAVTSVFNIATDGRRFRDTTAAEDSLFAFTAINQRSRDFNLETQAAFSLAANADKLRSAQADLSAVCSITVIARKIRDAHLTGTGVAALTCSASITAVVSAQMQSTVTIAANGGKQTPTASALTTFSSVLISKYAGSGRPRNLVPNNTVQFVAPGKYGSHAFGPVAPTTFVSGQLLLPRPVIPKSNQDWVWEGYYFLPFGALTETAIWTFNVGGGSRFVSLTARDDQRFILSMSKVGINFSASSTVSETRGDFLHLAVVYSNGFGALFVNGVRRILLNLSAYTTVDWTGKTVEAQDLTMSLAVRGTAALDEVSMHHGSTLGFDPQSLSLTVPTQPRVNNFATTQFLYHFNNNTLDDIVVLENAVGNFSAVSQISATLSGPVRASSSLVSTSSLQATISHIEGADLVAFANSTISVNADKLRAFAADISSVSSQATTVVKTASAISNIAASCDFTAISSRIRPFTADFTAISTQLTAVVRLAGLLADDLVSAILSADAVVTRSAVSSITSSAAVVADNFRVKFNSATISSEFTTNIQGFVGKIGNSDISADFAQVADANRFRSTTAALTTVSGLSAIGNNLGKIEGSLFNAVTMTTVAVKIARANANATTTATVAANTDISLTKTYQSAITAAFTDSFTAEKRVGTSVFLTAFASNLTAAVKQTVTDLDVNVVSTMSVSGVKTTSTSANLTTTATQTATAIKTVSAVSNQFSNFAQTAVAFRAVFAFADLSVLAFELAAAVKTAGISINTVTTATMTVSAVKTVSATSSVNSSIAVVAPVQRIRTTASAINSNFTQTSNAGRGVSAQATIASAMQFVAAVREIRLDNIVYVIPSETRVYVIKGETRIHSIREETRIYTI